ncbi:helix-turn-helix domain-containing protein [Myxosarcina sp. GI1(2024)]
MAYKLPSVSYDYTTLESSISKRTIEFHPARYHATHVSKSERELLLQVYKKGEEIPLFDSGIWQVARGVVQLSKISHDGQEVILGWATANSSFGNWYNEHYSYRVLALSNVYVKRYSPKDIEKNPVLARRLLAQLSIRLIKLEQLLAVTGLRKTEERLWQLLLILKQEMGQAITEGTRLQIRFTHKNLADIIGTTRVTVTRILGEIQQKGWIALDSDRHIIVKSRKSHT